MEVIKEFWTNTYSTYINNPWNIVTLIIDLSIVIILIKQLQKYSIFDKINAKIPTI